MKKKKGIVFTFICASLFKTKKNKLPMIEQNKNNKRIKKHFFIVKFIFCNYYKKNYIFIILKYNFLFEMSRKC